jgi:hypothetical protein
MKKRLTVLVIGPMAFQVLSFAQSTKPVPDVPPPMMDPSRLPPDPREFMNPEWSRAMPSGRAGDYLSGNVTLAGGGLPWEPIPVWVICDGKVRYTTNTDPKGNFRIAPVKRSGSTTIKSDSKLFASQFVGCAVEAALPGFISSTLAIAKNNVLDSPDVGTIALRREGGALDAALSSTSASAPRDATQWFEKARREWLANKANLARRDLQKAVEVYPQFAEAWYQLGKIQEALDSPEAWSSFSKAASADSKFALPYEHLAFMAAQVSMWQELVDATNRELELNPRGTLDIWYYNALGNYHLRKMDAAEASAVKSLSMDPLHVQSNTEQLLGITLAQKQDFAGALQHLRNCLTYLQPGPNLDVVKQQIAEIETAVRTPK